METALKRKIAGAGDGVDWEKAREVAGEARGFPVAVSPGSPNVDEMLARAPRVPRTPPWAGRESDPG